MLSESLRVDRWLYYCRFFKTRSKATVAVDGGHVKVNGERAAPGKRVKIGDRIDMVRERLPYLFEIVAIPGRRGPAAEAMACYREDEDTVSERETQAKVLRQDRRLMPKTEGRPEKRTRRKLIRRFRPES